MNNHLSNRTLIENKYQMIFTNKETTYANKIREIKLKPINNKNEEVVLETIHEKKIHLIIVSEDLSFFSHIHPEYNKGEYSIKFTFPFGGKFLLYAEYTPAGQQQRTDIFSVDVEGQPKIFERYDTSRTVAQMKDYKVVISTGQKTIINEEKMLPVSIIKKNIPLNADQLEDYLDAKIHAIMIHTKDKKFQHLHAVAINGELFLHANFTEQGFYRVWIQFKKDGELLTADFVIEVEGK